jgi:hypothetical protein
MGVREDDCGERHAEIAGGLSRIGDALHRPSRSGVTQRVARDAFLKAG